jgi:hypothetical protein
MRAFFRFLRAWLILLSLLAIIAAIFFLFPFRDDLGLHSAPHVARVEVLIDLWNARRRLIHVCDYHLVPPELHEGPEPYRQHVADVQAVQLEQRDLLRRLVAGLRLKAVYLEGLTAETVGPYRDKVAGLKAMQAREIPDLLRQLDEAKTLKAEGARKVEAELQSMLDEHLERVASVGAPGWLMMQGELAEVRPLDDEGPLSRGDPRKADAAAMKAHDDVIVKNALADREAIVVVVLGVGHDLTASVRAVDPNFGYIRLTTKKVAELVKSP